MVEVLQKKEIKTYKRWIFTEAEVYAILREKVGAPPSAISETRGNGEYGFDDIVIYYTETEEIS